MKDIICWFSGGVTSAVACKTAIDFYGKDRCKLIMLDTGSEDETTYTFLEEFEHWVGLKCEMYTMLGKLHKSGKVFNCMDEIFLHYLSLNVSYGAICSSVLKRDAREMWEKENEGTYTHQVFGFDFDNKEFNRAKSMKMNYPATNAIFPLLFMGYTKSDCIKILTGAGITLPLSYLMGYHNNNCFEVGCVQGGIGYWQKMGRDFPCKFDRRAAQEHRLTDLKGSPVTMLKDQSKKAKELVEETGDKTLAYVFLKPHPNYPDIKDISMMKGREPESLVDCNGFCGLNDLNKRKPAELEINYID